MTEAQQLEQAIAALEGQRALLGDAIVDAALAPMREKLTLLRAQQQPTHDEQRKQQPAQAEQERKQVTVLFADVSGFTALSETLDPEEVTDLINALWQRLDGAIIAQGGMIDKHIGDAVMALWGVEAAREDDPERAVRAALAMQAEIGDFAATLAHPLRLRIGLHTGPVLLSTVGTVGEFTAMGDTVNLASRLEHAAPVGGILISHDTYRQVRGVFNLDPLEPITVKGKAEPVRIYRVESARPRAFRVVTRGVEGVETRMIGRDDELAQLRDSFQQAEERGETRLITVVGEAGVGKSRLLYEFQSWLDPHPSRIFYFKGRASEQMRSVPYAMLRDLFADRFEVMESDSVATVRGKLEREIARFLGPESQARAHVLGAWLGYDFSASPHLAGVQDPQQLHERALGYLVELFAATAASGPTVMLLEDIHWADQRSLDAIEHLARSAPSLPLLVLCLTRPSLYEHRPAWPLDLPRHVRINLRRLSTQHSRQLAAEILRKAAEVPQALYDLVAERAEGNPFYVEELIKMLIDDGVIATEGEQWRVEGERLADLRVPQTLTGVLQARLDGLRPPEKLALQRASVVGRMFWEDAVAFLGPATAHEISSRDAAHALPEALTALRARELIFQRDQSAFEETREYIFKHALLRDVTYESVLRRERRLYHGQVARWLETVTERSGRADEYAALIAEHYEQAGVVQAAAAWYERAGAKARALYAPQAAVDYFTRAVSALDSAGQAAPSALYHARGKAFETLGRFDEARADMEAASERGRQDGDARAEWRALVDLGLLWAGRDYGHTGRYYEQALKLARTMRDQPVLGHSLNRLGNWYVNTEQFEPAETCHQEALAIFRASQDVPAVASTLDLMGMMSSLRGNTVAAQRYYEEAIALFRRLEDRPGLISSLSTLPLFSSAPFVSWTSVLVPMSREHIFAAVREALALAREIGWRAGQCYALLMLGIALAGQGVYHEALAAYDEGMAIANEIGHDQWRTAISHAYGDIYRTVLAIDLANQHYEQGLALARQIRSPYWMAIIAGSYASCYILQQRYDDAERLLDTYEPDPDATPESLSSRLLRSARVELLNARGQGARALELLDQLIQSEPNYSPEVVLERLWLLRAQLLMDLGRTEEAEPLLKAAVETAGFHGALPLTWHIQAALGRLLSRLGRQAEAEAARAEAWRIVEALASTLPDPALRAGMLDGAQTIIGVQRSTFNVQP